MRKSDTPPLAMSHSPAYYQHYQSPISSSPALTSSTPRLQPPPQAQVAYRTEKYPQGPEHVKASVSSATSGSTDATDPRSQHISQVYQNTWDPESGYGQTQSGRHSHRSPASMNRMSDSQRRPREMEQAPPATVIRYIRQEVDDDEEEEEPDHAIWILVSPNAIRLFHYFC